MQTVSGIGQVYTRMRNLKLDSQQSQLLANGTLHVWMIDRESTVLRDQSVNQNFTEQRDTICITGYLAVNDANDSADTFDALVDAILQAINNDRRPPSHLNQTVQTALPPYLRKKDFHEYGMNKVLVHHAEICIQVVWRELQ